MRIERFRALKARMEGKTGGVRSSGFVGEILGPRVILVFAGLLLGSCIGIAYHDPETTGRKFGHGPDSHSKGRPECTLHMDYVGWSYFPTDKSILEESLLNNGIRNAPESPWILEVTFEQTDVTPDWRRIPNIVITVLSSSLFPLVEYFQYHIEFRLRTEEGVTLFRRYRVMNHTVVSGLLTPFTPFYYPPSQRQKAVARASVDFVGQLTSFCRPF
ncbi:MAG: hypothetical protein CMN76_10735 [Spirochaetaceae bacterium]|nr:hypothetical protein [Spirochaetaceae bacterium]|tara:strand:+ start:18259 stop:18906 length:648 start_codon:yes stop_codon:yes gene_type:complete